MRQSTLLFLIKDDQILLAMKKRSFGEGKWNGCGGKPEANENILDTVIRETQEEIGVTPKNINQMAILNFYHQKNKEWNQQVLVFITHQWEGNPSETEEMKPQWFSINKLPFESMWPDDHFWLPLILKGQKIKASFTFDKDNQITEKQIEKVESL